ncbi:MAG: hypothetical protein Q9201_002402 [Fulgogasparrea decipioides]
MATRGRSSVDKVHRNMVPNNTQGADDVLGGNDAHEALRVTSSPTVRLPARIEELPIQPHRSSAWLERNPPQHIQDFQHIKDSRVNDQEATEAGRHSSPDVERRIQNLMRSKEPLDFILPWPQRDPSSGIGKTPVFKAGLQRWGLGPSNNMEIYYYYRDLDRTDVMALEQGGTTSMLREVLEEDANARQENARTVGQWTRQNEIGKGGYARVTLVSRVLLQFYENEAHTLKWEKQASDGGLVSKVY